MYIRWNGFNIFPQNLPEARPGGYLIQHIETGKSYIGISGIAKGVAWRGYRHSKGGSPRKLKAALCAEGLTKFRFIPLFYVIGEIDLLWLFKTEAELIAEFDAVNSGYNVQISSGRGGSYGPEFSRIAREIQERPDIKLRREARVREMLAQPEIKQAQSDAALLSWLPDAEGRKNRMAVWDRPGFREYHAAQTKLGLADPDTKYRQIEGTKLALANLSEDARARMLHVGCRWINDGVKNRRLAKSLPLPEGWKYGRCDFMRHHNRWHVNRSIVNPDCALCSAT